MKELINDLIKENKNILHTYPDIENNLRSSAGHRYMFNKEIISKLKKLLLHNVSQQRELLMAFDTMREFDIKHDDIEESVDYFLKNKESYL